MELYPSIDLRGGHVVRLYQGDFAKETVYGDDAVAVARAYEKGGASWIHVVDLDASREQGSNADIVAAIAASVSVPVQAGGGVRDAALLGRGVARIVVGSLAVADRSATATLIARHPGQVAVGLDHRDGELRVRGWEQSAGVGLLDAVGWPEFAAAAAFVVTNIARDATLLGPDVDGYRRLVETTGVPVIASGGVGTLDHLRALADTGVAGVIVGKALYEGAFGIEEAVAACSR